MATGELPVIGRWRRALAILAIGTFAFLYAWLVKRRGGRALVPASPNVRATLSGLALAAGLGLHFVGRATLGAPFLAAAMLLATVRAASADATGKPRGPGAWSALPAAVLLGGRGTAASIGIEPSSAHARVVAILRNLAALGLVALAVAAVRCAAADSPSLALAAIDALALLPLLLGGGRESSAVARARSRLGRVFRRLAHHQELRVVPWARVPAGRTTVDELRLRVEPRAPMPGANGVELGFVLDSSGASSPEVLVRVQTTSCASARIAALAPWAASVPGRTPEERVVRISPRWPSVRLAEKLTARMALALVDRRDESAKAASASRPSRFSGRDRRGAPSDSAISAATDASFAGLDAAADASRLLLR
jgi:hypothetical protein